MSLAGKLVADPSWSAPGSALDQASHRGGPIGIGRLTTLGIVLLAALLRFWGLDAQSIWYDEAVTLLLAAVPAPEIVRRTMEDTLPPLSYLMLHPWLQLGGSELLWRFPSVWFGVLTVALTARLGRSLGDWRTGAYAAGIVALSPFFVFYSQEVRLYAFLSATLAAYLLVSRTARSGGGTAVAALLGAAALYTHPLSALVLPVPAIESIVRRDDGAKRQLVALGLAAGLFFPWLAVLLGQSVRVMSTFWAEPVGPLRPLASFAIFAFGPPAGAAILGAGLVIILLVLALGGLRAARRRAPRGASFGLLLALLPPAALTILSQVRPIYLDRLLIGSAIGFALLVAVLVVNLAPALRGGIAAVWIALAGFGLAEWYTNPFAGKPPVREAAAFVAATARPADVVLHTSDGSHHVFRLHAPQLDNRLLAGDPEYAAGSPRGVWSNRVMEIPQYSIADIGASPDRIWVVILLDHSVDWQAEQAANIDRSWTRVDERRFRRVIVREYVNRGAHGG